MGTESWKSSLSLFIWRSKLAFSVFQRADVVEEKPKEKNVKISREYELIRTYEKARVSNNKDDSTYENEEKHQSRHA